MAHKVCGITAGGTADEDIVGVRLGGEGEGIQICFLGIEEQGETLFYFCIFTFSHFLFFPFEGFDHADDVRAEVVIDRCEGVGVRLTVTID